MMSIAIALLDKSAPLVSYNCNPKLAARAPLLGNPLTLRIHRCGRSLKESDRTESEFWGLL